MNRTSHDPAKLAVCAGLVLELIVPVRPFAEEGKHGTDRQEQKLQLRCLPGMATFVSENLTCRGPGFAT